MVLMTTVELLESIHVDLVEYLEKMKFKSSRLYNVFDITHR